MYTLRDYQQGAVDAACDYMMKSKERWLLELCTGAGKSLIVANIARWLHEKSNRKVLCLCPSKELVEQNAEKYADYGYDCSIFCAALNSKSIRYDVVFGTPQTVKNNIALFKKGFAGVIIDEAHEVTPTLKTIIEEMKKGNPQLRVGGLTATPYRMNEGYIYQYNEDKSAVDGDLILEPYFHQLLYKVTGPELIEQGYLTPPHADPEHVAAYDTSGLKRHNEAEYDRIFSNKREKTAEILNDVMAHTHNRRAVMIFAATRQHAREICEMLPDSRYVDGDTDARERAKTVTDFKENRFKFLVNVSVYTTGFDATIVDCVVLMRATESPGLLQQCIGRGLRLHEGKKDCLVLDYAENIERHQLKDDLFSPVVSVRRKGESKPMQVCCPECGYENTFNKRPNPDQLPISQHGYFADLTGEATEMPSHYGRRCFGFSMVNGEAQRCEYRWSHKVCDECGHENDIAARKCERCKAELISPEEKLVIEFTRVKKDPYATSTDKVLFWKVSLFNGKDNTSMVKVMYGTEYRSVTVWYNPSGWPKIKAEYEKLSNEVFGKVAPSAEDFVKYHHLGRMPETITYSKVGNYFRIYAYNQEEDKMPL